MITTKLALSMIALAAACAEPVPPFTYRVLHFFEDGTLPSTKFEGDFESFEAAVVAGPFTIELAERSGSQTLTLTPGYCRQYRCAGPLVREELTLSLRTWASDHIAGFQCAGLDGGVSGGIDGTFFGDCAR